ncbi:high affinity immunoglobulin gamma Fc receptor I [Fundulus heteroclitus]|uniref:high affinity immunoglobulin gamma Fc receptor I n=1 Tax=Fundulus heteroclitus TaxID=8078 RepID=UPI00165B62FA|nr:high affinity immunoglobulin gamma Fc receptor I [Fundulus heteroclitus]
MGHTWLHILLLFSSVISGYARVPITPTVIMQPNWPLIYRGETVILQCKIQGGGGSQWMYEWRPTRLNTSSIYVHTIEYDGGHFSCRGSSSHGTTDWSDVLILTVYQLSVSPSWLSPGDSVTLSCEVEHLPAGTRFFWYKAVPKLSGRYYSYELLPGSSNGTDENFYIVHGQTNTAGYVCEAGTGEPKYRDPSFVWSADPHPAASLSVSPDRVQHFRFDSVSLSCEGNSAEWRVRIFTEKDQLSDGCYWGNLNGSTCTLKLFWYDSGVFWCESGSGEFSNAVNITDQYNYGPILVSPVHPVAEGDPVTLSCRDKQQKLLSKVFFYHNDKLLHNDSREELNISAVSKSDEGFYKCQHSGKESPKSWMAVRALSSPATSSFPVMLIVGLVIGVVLFILLLLLWHYRRSRGVAFFRSDWIRLFI